MLRRQKDTAIMYSPAVVAVIQYVDGVTHNGLAMIGSADRLRDKNSELCDAPAHFNTGLIETHQYFRFITSQTEPSFRFIDSKVLQCRYEVTVVNREGVREKHPMGGGF